jgi:cytochrome c-type biogenesis protein CcmE
MSRRRNPTRIIIAISIAAILSVFLLYTSIAGGGTPALEPSELAGRTDTVSLAGKVVGPVSGDARGSVPDLFEPGRHVFVRGKLHGRTFVGQPDTLMTKCPSKYEAERPPE